MDDELDKFLRRLHNTKYKFRPRVNYQTRLKYYDVWQKIDPDIWVRHVLYRVNEKRATRNAVIPDARYMNEIKALEDDGFIFIRVSVDEKFYSKKTTHIKTLNDTVNSGAVDYYEWFAPNTDHYIHAKYSLHMESYSGINKAIDAIISDLTDGQLLPYNKAKVYIPDTEGEHGKEEISAPM